MTSEEKRAYLATLDENQLEYFKKVQDASLSVEAVLKKHPEFSKNDLYHIIFSLSSSIEERLRRGLRRRIIDGNPLSH